MWPIGVRSSRALCRRIRTMTIRPTSFPRNRVPSRFSSGRSSKTPRLTGGPSGPPAGWASANADQDAFPYLPACGPRGRRTRVCRAGAGAAADRPAASLLFSRDVPAAIDQRPEQPRLVARLPRTGLFHGGLAVAAESRRGYRQRRRTATHDCLLRLSAGLVAGRTLGDLQLVSQ